MQGKQIIRTQRKTGKPSQGRGENASVVCFRELSLFFFFFLAETRYPRFLLLKEPFGPRCSESQYMGSQLDQNQNATKKRVF